MQQIKAKLLFNKRLKGNYFHLMLLAPKIAKYAEPGQFVNVKVSNTDEPLLRRPFSIHRVNGANNIEILYEVVGKGTEMLSRRRPGEYLDIVGPLGKGFNYRLPITDYRLPILVAGGMGVAPLMFLAEKLITYNLELITVLIGAKNKSQIICADEFKKLGCTVKISTEDGSRGFRGKVTDLLSKILPKAISHKPEGNGLPSDRQSQKPLAIYACGPSSMLKAISQLSRRYKIPAQISLEEHMACGIGACLGCAVKIRAGYRRVCKDGPVFNAEEIIW